MINRVKEEASKIEQYIVDMRREFHQHPELSFKEFETTKRIAKQLDLMSIPYTLCNPTGLYADIVGSKPGKMVALRADIDALPVLELNDVSYKSVNEGCSHACGHDTHIAILLGAAKILSTMKSELCGTVRLLFQPAEELGAGAKMMIEQGALEGVSNVFGGHIWSMGDAGKISIEEGARFAACDSFFITFEGLAGHGAVPQATVDATVMAASFVMNVQTIVSRAIDPLHSAVVTIGKMESGTRFNVISGEAKLDGTVRTLDGADRRKIEETLRHYADMTAKMYGGKVKEFTFNHLTDIVYNESKSAKRARTLVAEAFGEDSLYAEPPTTGGEDFGAFSDIIDGAFAIFGAGNKEKDACWSHHHGRFNVDEDVLVNASQLYALYALDYLGENND